MIKVPAALLATLFLVIPIAATADDLMSGIPTPPDSKPLGGTKPIHSGGVLTSYTSSADSAAVLDSYANGLPTAGWTVVGSGSGGSGWGGGGGLRATNGPKYLVVRAGGPAGVTFVKVCVWPAKPDNRSCDDDD
jgi:hypothetical protein